MQERGTLSSQARHAHGGHGDRSAAGGGARAHALHLQCWVACELVALAVRMPFPCAPVRGAAGVAAPSSTVSAGGRAAAAAPQRAR